MSADRFHLDHVLPRSLDGSDELENLALACSRCNQRRSNAVIGIDPESKTEAPLFNPRQAHWRSHFIWTADCSKIVGQTAIGRATVQRLDLNDERYPGEDSIRQARWFWQQGGWHPPEDDPVMDSSPESDHEPNAT